MTSKPTWSRARALIGAVCLSGGVSMALAIVVVMFLHSLHSFSLWFIVLLWSVLALYGGWVLRMAFPGARPGGKAGRRVNETRRKPDGQPTKPDGLGPDTVPQSPASGTA